MELRIADYQDFLSANHEYRKNKFIFEDAGDWEVREQEEREDYLEDLHDAWLDSMAERY